MRGRLEAALLAVALLTLVVLVGHMLRTDVHYTEPRCSGTGRELAGSCAGHNPGHVGF